LADRGRCTDPNCPLGALDSAGYGRCSQVDCGSSLPRCPICVNSFVEVKDKVCANCHPAHCDVCGEPKLLLKVTNKDERVCYECFRLYQGPVLDVNRKLRHIYGYTEGKANVTSPDIIRSLLRLNRKNRLESIVTINGKKHLKQPCRGCKCVFHTEMPAKGTHFCSECLYKIANSRCLKCGTIVDVYRETDDYGRCNECQADAGYDVMDSDSANRYLVERSICVNCEEQFASSILPLCHTCEDKHKNNYDISQGPSPGFDS